MELSRLFDFRSVVLIGATDRSTWSKMAFANLQTLGFKGKIHLVSRSAGMVHGRQTLRSVSEIGEPVDVALLLIPIASVPDALREVAAAGIRFAVVLAGDVADQEEQGRDQEELAALARKLGITLLGPNCLGFINFLSGAVCWTGSMRTPPRKGAVSLVSQSGAVATTVSYFAHQQGVGLNLVAATGNEAMLSLADVVDHLVDDPGTRVIAMFVESIRDRHLFERAARRALLVGKPIVVLKVGRSDIAVEAARSHTGAIVGDDKVFDGVCRQWGLIRTRSIEELVFTSGLLEITGPLSEKGVGLISPSGGMGEIAADYAHLEGVPLPALAPATLERLKSILPAMATPANPLDLTGAVVKEPDLFRQCMEAMSRDPGLGLLITVSDVPTAINGDWAPFAVGSIEAIGRFRAPTTMPQLLVSGATKFVSERSREVVEASKLPYLSSGIEQAFRAARHAFTWSVKQRSARAVPASPPESRLTPVPLSERDVLAFLEERGVSVVPGTLARNENEAVAAARKIGGAVVLKIASPDIAHKTEVGGVLLNLESDEAVADGYRRIIHCARETMPSARLDGVLVAPMRKGGIELFVGVRRDPQWGHVIAVGLGGVWIEALEDVSLRLLPIDANDAAGMLRDLRGAKVLQGYRGAAPVDMDKLADTVVRIGDAALALGKALDTLEVNPILVDGARIEALDALATSLATQQ